MIHDVVSAGPTAGRVASQQRGKREYLIELHQFPLASCLFCVCVCVCFFSFSSRITGDPNFLFVLTEPFWKLVFPFVSLHVM
jgi:hypothetical protein